MNFLFIISALLCFRLVISLLLEKSLNINWTGHSYSLVANLLWVIIFGKILSNPEILFGLPKLEERVSTYLQRVKIKNTVWNFGTPEIKNVQDSYLKQSIDGRIKKYVLDIENFIGNVHPFRDPNFSLKEIAKELDIPTSHLAYIFKYHCKFPFVEYKNYSRIIDALILIEVGFLNKRTFEAVADKSGFNSYNSFFVAFKKQTGHSPKDYITIQKIGRKSFPAVNLT